MKWSLEDGEVDVDALLNWMKRHKVKCVKVGTLEITLEGEK